MVPVDLLEQRLDLAVVAVVDGDGDTRSTRGGDAGGGLVNGARPRPRSAVSASARDVHGATVAAERARNPRTGTSAGTRDDGHRFGLCHSHPSEVTQSEILAAALSSVIGRARPCSSQMICNLRTVSATPGPNRFPGVKVAGN